jgi:hypothetical protein
MENLAKPASDAESVTMCRNYFPRLFELIPKALLADS